MAERDHIDHETGTENGEAMHTDAIHAEAMHTDAIHAEAIHADAIHTEAIHAEAIHTDPTDVITTDEPAPPARRRGPDPLTLLVGLATLAMAVFAFVGYLPDLSGVDARWLLAGGAAVVGLVLLVGNLRNRSGGRRSG